MVPPDVTKAVARAARGFAAVVGWPPVGFACPLCLREVDPGCVTRGHYPASSVGGSRWAPLCKACNNSVGTAYEPDAKAWFSRDDPKATMSTATVGSVHVSASVDDKATDGRTAFNFTLPRKAGGATSHLLADLKPGNMFKLRLQGPAPDRVRLAVLSWAHLAAFATYGYAFALEPALRDVRALLLDPSAAVLPSVMITQRPTPASTSGEISLVIALRQSAGVVRLVGLGVDFGMAVGMLPIASDTDVRVYRDLEALVLNQTSWTVHVAPIGDVIKFGAKGDYEAGTQVATPPYVVVGVSRPAAQHELANARVTPLRRRGTRAWGVVVPEQPASELPHRLGPDEWQDWAAKARHRPRFLSDLRRVALDGQDVEAVVGSDEFLSEAIARARSRFPLADRPRIGYRGALFQKDGREIGWLWGRIEWPDGRSVDLGPVFSATALAEEIALQTA